MPIKYRTKDDALRAVIADGRQLEHVAPDFCDDEDVITAAIQNGGKIFHASFRLQNSHQIIMLYAKHCAVPENDFSRALYCVQQDLNIIYSEYCSCFLPMREFNLYVKLYYGEMFTSPFSEYNFLKPEDIQAELQSLRCQEIEYFRDIFRRQYTDDVMEEVVEDCAVSMSPLRWPALSVRGKNQPFATLLSSFTTQLNRLKQEKDDYFNFCQRGSYPERFIDSLLTVLDIEYSREYIFPWSEGTSGTKGVKRYDFYLPKLNAILEIHGAQHYEGSFEHMGGRTLKQEQDNDLFKELLARENEIAHYIVVNGATSSQEYLKNSIESNKEFTDLIDIKALDWDRVYSQNSIKSIPFPSPVYNINTQYITSWRDLFKSSLTDADNNIPPKPIIAHEHGITEELEKNISEAIPSSLGLYPHELLLLYDATRLYAVGQTEYPGKWYYGYGIGDVSYYINKLYQSGFMKYGGLRRTLEMATVPKLKFFMTQHGLTTTGKKEKLIDSILDNIDEVSTWGAFPDRYWELTESGKKEIVENTYLWENTFTELSIWELNKLNANGSLNTVTQQSLNCWPSEIFDCRIWRSSADLAAKEKNYAWAMLLEIDVLYHDFEIRYGRPTIETLKYYFPYAKSILRCAPKLIDNVRRYKKILELEEQEFLENVKSVVNKSALEISVFTAEECAEIIVNEVVNNPAQVANIYEKAHLRLMK